MGLLERLGIVFTNVAVLIPVFILLLVAAIISTRVLKNLTNQPDTHRVIKNLSIALWVLFAGGLAFSFTFGIVIIPWIVTFPYLYGTVLSLFILMYLTIAGIFLYQGYKLRKMAATDASVHKAANNLLICGGVMIGASLFMLMYLIYTIHKYRKGGGFTGDVALVGKYGGELAMAAGQPEIAIPLQQLGGMAEKNLTQSQQAELQQRGRTVQQVGGYFYRPTTEQSSAAQSGLQKLLQNPDELAAAAKLFK